MARRSPPTLETAMESIARSLREFGYPDTTKTMIREVYDAYLAGKRGEELPHGIVGRFAEAQIDENRKLIASLSK